jgi:hypothetical protein
MNGFKVPSKGGPVPMMPSNRLAQIAAAAFKPPGPMAMPSMSAPQMGGGGGDGGLGAGLAGLSSIAGVLGPLMGGGAIMNAGPQGSGPGGSYTTADAMGMARLNDGQTLGPMDPGYGDLGGPRPSQGGGGGDPHAAMATNPYLSMTQAPDWKSMLANALIGVGAGISQADASGRGWASGIAPGLLMGTQLTNNAQRQAEEMALRRAQYAMMLDRLRTQGAR